MRGRLIRRDGTEAVSHTISGVDRRGVVLRASAAALLVLLGGGTAAWALRSSPSAQAQPAPSGLPAPGTSASTTTPAGSFDAQPLTAAAASTSSPLRPGASTLVLGDSLALDVYPWLADLLPDRYVSYAAVVGRATPATYAALRSLPKVPPLVLVSLGTNDLDPASFARAAEEILTYLGPHRCVVWSDVVRPDWVGGGAAAINAVIERLASTRPNLHVLHWTSMVAAHPEWLGGDGIHPRPAGAQARAEAFAAAALACSPFDASAPRASKQVLPASAFTAPGPGSGTTSTAASTPTNVATPSPRTSHASVAPARSTSSSPGTRTPPSSPSREPASASSPPALPPAPSSPTPTPSAT